MPGVLLHLEGSERLSGTLGNSDRDVHAQSIHGDGDGTSILRGQRVAGQLHGDLTGNGIHTVNNLGITKAGSRSVGPINGEAGVGHALAVQSDVHGGGTCRGRDSSARMVQGLDHHEFVGLDSLAGVGDGHLIDGLVVSLGVADRIAQGVGVLLLAVRAQELTGIGGNHIHLLAHGVEVCSGTGAVFLGSQGVGGASSHSVSEVDVDDAVGVNLGDVICGESVLTIRNATQRIGSLSGLANDDGNALGNLAQINGIILSVQVAALRIVDRLAIQGHSVKAALQGNGDLLGSGVHTGDGIGVDAEAGTGRHAGVHILTVYGDTDRLARGGTRGGQPERGARLDVGLAANRSPGVVDVAGSVIQGPAALTEASYLQSGNESPIIGGTGHGGESSLTTGHGNAIASRSALGQQSGDALVQTGHLAASRDILGHAADGDLVQSCGGAGVGDSQFSRADSGFGQVGRNFNVAGRQTVVLGQGVLDLVGSGGLTLVLVHGGGFAGNGGVVLIRLAGLHLLSGLKGHGHGVVSDSGGLAVDGNGVVVGQLVLAGSGDGNGQGVLTSHSGGGVGGPLAGHVHASGGGLRSGQGVTLGFGSGDGDSHSGDGLIGVDIGIVGHDVGDPDLAGGQVVLGDPVVVDHQTALLKGVGAVGHQHVVDVHIVLGSLGHALGGQSAGHHGIGDDDVDGHAGIGVGDVLTLRHTLEGGGHRQVGVHSARDVHAVPNQVNVDHNLVALVIGDQAQDAVGDQAVVVHVLGAGQDHVVVYADPIVIAPQSPLSGHPEGPAQHAEAVDGDAGAGDAIGLAVLHNQGGVAVGVSHVVVVIAHIAAVDRSLADDEGPLSHALVVQHGHDAALELQAGDVGVAQDVGVGQIVVGVLDAGIGGVGPLAVDLLTQHGGGVGDKGQAGGVSGGADLHGTAAHLQSGQVVHIGIQEGLVEGLIVLHAVGDIEVGQVGDKLRTGDIAVGVHTQLHDGAVTVGVGSVVQVLDDLLVLAAGGQLHLLAAHDGVERPHIGAVRQALLAGGGLQDHGVVLHAALSLAQNHGADDVLIVVHQSVDIVGNISLGGQIHHDVHILHAGVHAGHVGDGAVSNALVLVHVAGLHSDIHGVVVAVAAGAAGGQVSAVIRSVCGIVSHPHVGAVDDLLVVGVHDLVVVGDQHAVGLNGLQGVHTRLGHSVGEPAVDLVLAAGVPLVVLGGKGLVHIAIVANIGAVQVLVGVGHVDLDHVHGAVQEDGGRVGGVDGDMAAGAVIAGNEHVVQVALVQIHADGVAVLIQNDVVGHVGEQVLIVQVQHVLVVQSQLRGIVRGAVGGQALEQAGVHIVVIVRRELGDGGPGQDLGIRDSHGLVLGAILQSAVDQQVLIGGHTLDSGDLIQVQHLGLALGAVGAVRGVIDPHGQGLAVLVVVAVGTGQPGVNGGNGDLLVVQVHEHLSQHTVAGLSQLAVVGADQVVLLDHIAPVLGVLAAVQIGLQAVLPDGGRGEQVVQLTAGHAIGVSGNDQLVLHVGADLRAVISPGAGGTLEVVAGLVVQLQVAHVQLLAQFHDGPASVSGGIGGAVIIDGNRIGLVAGDVAVLYVVVDGHIADGPAAVSGSLHGAGLQGIQHQLSHIVAGHGGGHAGVHAHEQVDGVGLTGGGQLPVAAEVRGVLEIAQGLHQHQGGLGSGHGVGTTVNGVAVTAGDTVGPAGGHVGLRPGGHIRKRRGVLVGGHIIFHQIGHNNSHLVAGDVLIGIEIAVLVADHDAHGLENVNGFHIVLRSHVRVARSAGAHHHQAGNHGRGETQAESTLQVSHWNSSF